MTAYYCDSEEYVVQWTRNLIGAGLIAPGVVDGRSIKEVVAADVREATQAHFFSGIGIWSHALRLAGWPDELEGLRVWTGSCPCQGFSSAGKKRGFEDERHLWPEWFRLICECRPDVILGEQVSSPDGLKWLDLVSTDLEGAGYAVGPLDSCAASVGAPHQRQRLYFVAYADSERCREVFRNFRARESDAGGGSAVGALAYTAESGWLARWRSCMARNGGAPTRLEPRRLRDAGELAHANGVTRDEGSALGAGSDRGGDAQPRAGLGGGRGALELAHAYGERLEGRLQLRVGGPRADLLEALGHGQAGGLGYTHGDGGARYAGAGAAAQAASRRARHAHRAVDDSALASGPARVLGDASGEGLERRASEPRDDGSERATVERAGGATSGFWRDAEWIFCRDGKWRPVESKYEPLADGATTGVGSVRTERRAIWPLSTGELSRVGRIKGYGNAIVGPLAAAFIRAFMDVVAVQ